jgi:hypothetical protein
VGFDLGALRDYINNVDMWDSTLDEDDVLSFKMWCLGHNFDVVGAIMSVASLSWEKGYDAGITIADFTNRTDAANAAREYLESMALFAGPGD